MAAARSTRQSSKQRRHGRHARRWSKQVGERSDALDLEPDTFKRTDPKEIAAALKRSAEHSRRRKGTAFQSAMSMLNFYINRAGKNLPKTQLATLQRARGKLREAFGRAP